MTAVLAQTVASPWTFHLHPDVIGVCLALFGGYVYALKRWGPLFRPRPDQEVATGRQKAAFAGGVVAFFAAVGWPVHDIAENYLYSAHMVQHILLGFVVPPLLLLGMPDWMGELVLGRGLRGRIYRKLARPIPAAIAFNAALAFIHWPRIVDLMLASDVLHELSHFVFLAGAVLMWSVLHSPVPEVRRSLSEPGKMLFLFVQTILPTVPASFLTFGETPLYRVYETFPRLWGLSPRDDMQLAGLLMKVGAGLLLWSILAVMFFRWANREEADARPVAGPRDDLPEPSPTTRWS